MQQRITINLNTDSKTTDKTTILEYCRSHGIAGIETPCGGKGTCGKCKVTVTKPYYKDVLACQTKICDGMEIIVGRKESTGTSTGLRFPQDDISPTPAGINMTGIISIMNLPALLTELSGIRPVSRPMKSITMPYMLAGTGNGSKYLSISPTNEIASMMRNCFNNFILYCISVILFS